MRKLVYLVAERTSLLQLATHGQKVERESAYEVGSVYPQVVWPYPP